MIGMVLVTHGRLASEFVAALEHVVGTQVQIAAVCIGPNDDMEERRQEILRCIADVDSGDGAVVLTDMFGGTPSNISLSFLERGRVEIVTGVNLPMVVKFATLAQDATDVATLAHVISEKGSKAIRVASDLLVAR